MLQAHEDVTVQLSRCHFADASLMLDLAMIAQRLRTRGLVLRLCGAQAQIVRLIELCGLDRMEGIELAPSQEPLAH